MPTYQLNINAEKQATASKNAPVQASRFTDSLVFVTLALLVVGLLTCGFIIEARILSRSPMSFLFGDNPLCCSPEVADLSNVKYHSDHEYYRKLREITPLQPPVFYGAHAAMCKNRIHLKRKHRSFDKCLPISGLKDPTVCKRSDRMDMLTPISSERICHASVLHMLLVEVYEELQALGKSPVILYGSLLGAVREKGVISFTEDADIGYSGKLRVADNLHRLLWQKGYHLFFLNIWRVCVAPTHPLAGKLYDANVSPSVAFAVPYLDLYNMNQQGRREWKIEEMNVINGSSLLPDDKVRPFSHVTINGQQFDTVHDTEYLLKGVYGEDYMTPKPREKDNPQALTYFNTNGISADARDGMTIQPRMGS
ncbi:hypothetical protein PHYPSEUDO_001722 [Phytophthora pseudosyringae]|uniref:Uncharacterized protein n=1 Tax=Phytophthora pseudosyringae TaxID=221518 RepID=A0A8T1VZB8_9STRA|nr:hypothetical protein PHYPSEUDO_001722 [Phytophthora pseudosyringae]